jgi:hypothetical protein
MKNLWLKKKEKQFYLVITHHIMNGGYKNTSQQTPWALKMEGGRGLE